ncbi:hypothetical protein HMPREF6745_1615 [Prevotella sp. oral taxon 472 str. F0295]|nr:hypothetical protein HMPREF6745_1615 [Prevotella sp. oral taxon 472 str. F0295]
MVPNECQALREFGIRHDAFLSKIREKTNGYLTNWRHPIRHITIVFYPELA